MHLIYILLFISNNFSKNSFNLIYFFIKRLNNNFVKDIHMRQKAWDSKKNSNIEILKQKTIEKEFEECNFRPKLVIFFDFY
jgi:hypothetical protein